MLYVLALVTNTVAVVRFRLSHRSDVCSRLPDKFFADAGDRTLSTYPGK